MAETVELVNINLEDVQKDIDRTTESIVELEEANKSLRKELKKTNEELEAEGKSRTDLNKEIALNSESLKSLKKERSDSIKLIKSEANSINQLKQRNAQLRRERDNLNINTKQGRERLKEINAELDKNNVKIEKNTSKLEQQKIGIGRYEKAMAALPRPLANVVGGIQNITKAGLKFIATPIGAVIGALALAVKGLTSFFTKSAEGQERWNRIMGKARAAAGVFGDRIRDVGKSIVDFTDNIKNSEEGLKGWAKNVGENARGAWKRFRDDVKDQGFFKAVGDAATGAYDTVIGKVKELNEEVKEAARLGEQLAQRQNNLRREEIEQFTARARLQTEIADLILLTRDRENVSNEEAIAAIKRAQVLKQQEFDQEIKLAKERLELKRFENSLSDSTLEDLQEEAELERDLILLEKQRADQQRELLNREIELKNRIRAEEEKARKEEEDLINKQIEADLQQAEDDINFIIEQNEKELDLWQQKEKAKTKATEEEEAKRRKLVNTSLDLLSQSANAYFSFAQNANAKSLDAQLAAAEGNAEKQEQIRREFAKKEQNRAIKQALVNAALAGTKTAANLGFPAAIPALIALAIATGVQISQIKAQQFAQGGEVKSGVFSGSSHAGGGIDLYTGSGQKVANVEGGEGFYVVNKKDNPEAIAALSSINSQHGKAFAPRTYMQDGGEAAISDAGGLTFEQAVSLIRAVPIQVEVTDINDAQSVEAQVTSNGEI